jgi:hypothetical protein
MLKFIDMVQSNKECIPNFGGKNLLVKRRIALQRILGRYIVKWGGNGNGTVSWP